MVDRPTVSGPANEKQGGGAAALLGDPAGAS
jgi:hypothetical protein